jgi:hypothetical protein
MLSMLTTDQKGVLAEQAIVFESLKLGVGVFQPLGDERYDLILDLRPDLLRVQCKWAVRQATLYKSERVGADEGRTGSFIVLMSPGRSTPSPLNVPMSTSATSCRWRCL